MLAKRPEVIMKFCSSCLPKSTITVTKTYNSLILCSICVQNYLVMFKNVYFWPLLKINRVTVNSNGFWGCPPLSLLLFEISPCLLLKGLTQQPRPILAQYWLVPYRPLVIGHASTCSCTCMTIHNFEKLSWSQRQGRDQTFVQIMVLVCL